MVGYYMLLSLWILSYVAGVFRASCDFLSNIFLVKLSGPCYCLLFHVIAVIIDLIIRSWSFV
jgi:hypothetical protein